MLNQASGPKQHRKTPMTPASQNRHKGQPVRGQPKSYPQSRTAKDCRRGPTPQKAPIPGYEGQFIPTPPKAGYPRPRPSRQEAPQVQGPAPLASGSAPHQSDQTPSPPHSSEATAPWERHYLPRRSKDTICCTHSVWGGVQHQRAFFILTHYHTHSPDTHMWVINAQPIHRGSEKQLSFKWRTANI